MTSWCSVEVPEPLDEESVMPEATDREEGVIWFIIGGVCVGIDEANFDHINFLITKFMQRMF